VNGASAAGMGNGALGAPACGLPEPARDMLGVPEAGGRTWLAGAAGSLVGGAGSAGLLVAHDASARLAPPASSNRTRIRSPR